jgi:hypothetical protein
VHEPLFVWKAGGKRDADVRPDHGRGADRNNGMKAPTETCTTCNVAWKAVDAEQLTNWYEVVS